MDECIYPVFLQGQWEWVIMINSSRELQSRVEPIDVDDNEYRGWDSLGRRVGLSMSGDTVVVSLLSEETVLTELRQSIVQFAVKFGGGAVPPSDMQAEEPARLFDWATAVVEQYEKEHTLAKRIHRYIKRIFGRE